MEEIISFISKSIIPIIIILSIISKNKNSDRKKREDTRRKKIYDLNDYEFDKDVYEQQMYSKDYYSDNVNDVPKTNNDSYTYDNYTLSNNSGTESTVNKRDKKIYNKDDESFVKKTEIKDTTDFELDFNKEDIIKGIIMTEILSKPRCLQKR